MRKVAEIYTVSRTTGQSFPMCSYRFTLNRPGGVSVDKGCNSDVVVRVCQRQQSVSINRQRRFKSFCPRVVAWRNWYTHRKKSPVWGSYSKSILVCKTRDFRFES